MPTSLLLDLANTADAAWKSALLAAVPHQGAACGGHDLVQRAHDEAPTSIICVAPGLAPELAAALAAWNGTPPCAVLLLTPDTAVDEPAATRAAELGIHHWQAILETRDGVALARAIAAAGALAHARWRHEHALRGALSQAQAQLDERKWVDRAKGVLMAARGMDEDDAFRLLRGAAMNVNLRVGELARAVFESAQWAEGMNRAGQLRMLSQRLVRLVAQRLLRIETRAAAVLEQQSAQRIHDNLAMLARLCADTSAQPAHALAARHWQALAEALAAPRMDLATLLRIDALATPLVEAAEQLTEALQAAAGRRALHIVNQCGRQRLRALRVAKESLLAALHRPGPESQALLLRRDAGLDAFETAQRELEQAPLSTPEIRALLAQVRDEWLRLLGGLRATATADGRRALVDASERLFERLDALTAAYEHSLQVLMG